ncbi:MAG: DUF58 domain-containing protein [Coprococcus sp.]
MKRGFWYILFIGACIYIGILNRKEIYVYIAIFMTAIMLMLWGGLILNCARTKLALSIAIPVAEKNQPFHPAIEVRTSWGNIPAVSADFKVIGAGVKDISVEEIVQIDSNYGKCQGELYLPVSGRYEIVTRNVRIYDPLNIFYIRKRIKSSAYVYVLPGCYTTAIDVTKTTRDFVAESDIYYSAEKGDDYSETYQIREYQPGDRIMNINWKMSARLGDLMVKDPSRPMACPVIICMNLGGIVKKNYGRQLSVALEAMVSISYSMICVKVPHFIAWYDPVIMDITRYRIVCEEDVYDAASKLSLVRMTDMTGQSVKEKYQERFRGEEFTTMIDIDMNGYISSGEYKYHVEYKNLKKDIEAIYLRV